MGKTKKKNNAWRARSAAGALGAAFFLQAPSAQADPADKVYLPTVEQGEWELELRGGWQQWRNHDDDRERQVIVDVGYGFTSWWKTELAVGITQLRGTSRPWRWIDWWRLPAVGGYDRGRHSRRRAALRGHPVDVWTARRGLHYR